MNEVTEMRELLETVQTNLDRFRWIITNPNAARRALEDSLKESISTVPDVSLVVKHIDIYRSLSGG